jgi:hypothetical protein
MAACGAACGISCPAYAKQIENYCYAVMDKTLMPKRKIGSAPNFSSDLFRTTIFRVLYLPSDWVKF